MDPLVCILVPGLAAVASAMLAWFVMQSRLEVKLAEERERMAGQREGLAEQRGELKAEKAGLEGALQTGNRKSLVLQERMYFRGIPLSDWIEHEIVVEAGEDVDRLVQDMTVFDKGVVSIADIPRTRQPFGNEISVETGLSVQAR